MSDSRTRKKAQSDFERNGAKVLPTALESRFAEARSQLGPHRQQLIRAILENCEETCFLSSRELAKRYSVDARRWATKASPISAWTSDSTS